MSGVLSGGVAPIFAEIAEHCARADELMIFPCGSYGYFMASAEFHGARVIKVKTNEASGFKVDPDHLKTLLTENSKQKVWLILSAPIVNPTGAIYNSEELREIAGIIANQNGVLVLDSIFSGLGFSEGDEKIQKDILQNCHSLILGGLSKEFAAGGLRVGYALSKDTKLLEIIKACELTAPHKTLQFALKKLYQSAEHIQSANLMKQALQEQRELLKKRAASLGQILKSCGWQVLESYGGLFLVATPKVWLGKTINGKKIEMDNLVNLLRESSGVVINSPEWIGLPNYFRFVLSVSELEFKKALAAIKKFDSSIH
jgi:methionine S-methyltransferase